MKKSALSTLSALAVLAVLNTNAFATDGTITFNGEVTNQTCSISVNGAEKSAIVTLPSVSASNLSSIGSTSGATQFNIALSECYNGAGSVYAFFEKGSYVSTDGRLSNTGTASNVSVRLKDDNQSVINVGSDEQTVSAAKQTLLNGAATLTYSAEYYAEDAVTAGTVLTSVTYEISYI